MYIWYSGFKNPMEKVYNEQTTPLPQSAFPTTQTSAVLLCSLINKLFLPLQCKFQKEREIFVFIVKSQDSKQHTGKFAASLFNPPLLCNHHPTSGIVKRAQ